MRFMVHPTEAQQQHNVEIVLLNADGQEVVRIPGGFNITDIAALAPGEEAAVNFPVIVNNVVIPAAGAYSFELLNDGIHQVSVPFWAADLNVGGAP